MKKVSLVISILALLTSFVLVAQAHSGRTDGSGGHTDHSSGEYHYHHGYPAHDHYDMDGDGDLDCPYDFDNQTSRKSNAADKVSQPTTAPTAGQTTKSGKINNFRFEFVLKIVISVAVIGLWILPIFFNNKK